MDYEFIIREAEIDDIKDIYTITKKAFEKYVKEAEIPGSVDALGESLEDIIKDINTKEVYVALYDNLPVGTIRIEQKPGNMAYITRFAVLPEYQNNGIGKSIMSYVDKLFISRGVNKVFLYTASKHKSLVCFYYNMGFYIDSTNKDRDYIRALMVKEYLYTS